MPAKTLAEDVPHRVDLETLDSFLISDRAPPGCMMLSDLDGFLTGVAVGPEMILPSEWLPMIWGGEELVSADEAEAEIILGIVMGRYNEIIQQVQDHASSPVFWCTRDETFIASDWAEGFLQAIALCSDAWEPLLKSKRDGPVLFPILALCSDENGDSLLGLSPDDENWAMEQATNFIPACVNAIADYWHKKATTQIFMPFAARVQSYRTSIKLGRIERTIQKRK
jgi:uncharacterized protein